MYIKGHKTKGGGKLYISLNSHLARVASVCAHIRAQRIIDGLPTGTHDITQEKPMDTAPVTTSDVHICIDRSELQ